MTTNQDSPNTAGEAEPVRWMYEQPRHEPRYFRARAVRYASQGWTETPLYVHPPQRPSVVPDEVVEAVALALANYDCAQTDCPTLSSIKEFRSDIDRNEYLRRADAALSAIPADPVPGERKFNLGDRVTKTKGSSWTGYVVGFYSTSLTKVGYAVESENEPGSVQIYPEGALAACRGGEMETHKETEL